MGAAEVGSAARGTGKRRANQRHLPQDCQEQVIRGLPWFSRVRPAVANLSSGLLCR